MLAPGLNAVTSERSFIVYAMAVHATGAQLIETPMREDGFDLDAILNAINEDTRIVFLANPNNPTGTMLDADAVDKFMAEVPGHVVVVLDEAYYEFAVHFAAQRKVEYSRSLDYLRQGASVVVLRTFSKAHGLAGLRVGYGLGPAELMAYCARMRDTYSVSSVAQAAALAALDDQNHIGRVGFEQCGAGADSGRGIVGVGISSGADVGEFSLLRCGRGCCGICGATARRGSERSPAGSLGRAELRAREYWHAGAESVLVERGAEDRRAS